MNKLTYNNLFDGLFSDLTNGFAVSPLHGNPLPSASQIKIDIHEHDDSFEVIAELPGVAKENIDISIDNALVTIRAEVNQHDKQEKEGKLLRSERYFGAVSRSVQLPVDVDTDKCEASYEDGLLKLNLAKLQGSKSKKLTVK